MGSKYGGWRKDGERFYFLFIYLLLAIGQAPGGRSRLNILHLHGLRNNFLKVRVGRDTCEACSGNLELSGAIPAFAQGPRETRKNLCRDGRSQDLLVTDL